MKELIPYIVNIIEQAKCRYDVRYFDSGAVMIDIWINAGFYVIQIDGDIIGLNLVTPETAWDIIPDQSFGDKEAFKKAFESIFKDSTTSKTNSYLNIEERKPVWISISEFYLDRTGRC